MKVRTETSVSGVFEVKERSAIGRLLEWVITLGTRVAMVIDGRGVLAQSAERDGSRPIERCNDRLVDRVIGIESAERVVGPIWIVLAEMGHCRSDNGCHFSIRDEEGLATLVTPVLVIGVYASFHGLERHG